MAAVLSESERPLPLRAGEWVEVRSQAEILATLDENGELDGLPFMPEMFGLCGRRLRVHRRADKTCDTISGNIVARRMRGVVHLEGVRCDGSAHAGCQAACLVFWKEAWLRRTGAAPVAPLWRLAAGSVATEVPAGSRGCTRERVEERAVRESAGSSGPTAWRCQITQLLEASSPLAWWQPGQYLRDWLSRNVSLAFLLKIAFLRMLSKLVVGRGFRLKVRAYDAIAKWLGETPWPYHPGRVEGRTPVERLDLRPGEWVTVKAHAEILETLKGMHNRGLSFAPEMVRYCGGTYRVRARVDRILDEKTGVMVPMKNDCIILEDVVCQSECSAKRLFCPRSIYPYWREIWLRRADPGETVVGSADGGPSASPMTRATSA